MYSRILFLVFLVLSVNGCQSKSTDFEFTFLRSDQGVEILENGQSVLFYQEKPKSLTGEYVCNNYIHPLFSLDGDTLTEEFPKDHPHHRGIFLAWHQVHINGESVGNSWLMEDLETDVRSVNYRTSDNAAILETDVAWKSPLYQERKEFMNEKASIKVHPLEKNIRKIDYVITLKALVDGVEIGGADNEKGYGGLCMRIKLPEDLVFSSINDVIEPEVNQIKAGSIMDFSGSFSEKESKSGVTLLCHPNTPNYPAPWILRSKASMQNVVFPGQELFSLPLNKEVKLYYRLIVHNGDASDIRLYELQKEYEDTNFKE